MAAKGFVTAGTWCADHNKIVTHWPGEEEVVEILSESVRGGGSACNLAIDMKRLDPDIPVATIGLLGDDEDGRTLLAEARGAGLDVARLRVKSAARTSRTDAFTSRRSGKRSHFYNSGVAGELSPSDFQFDSGEARFLHLGLPGVHPGLDGPSGEDANGWVTVLRRARAASLETSLELCSLGAARLEELVRPCLPHLDRLIINDFEINAIVGRVIDHDAATDVDACEAAAREALRLGAMELVVVHFPEGAIAVSRDGATCRSASIAMTQEEIAGPNGAGDAFAAGLLYGVHEGWTIENAMTLAHACAAVSLTDTGTTDAIRPWRECLSFARQRGFNLFP